MVNVNVSLPTGASTGMEHVTGVVVVQYGAPTTEKICGVPAGPPLGVTMIEIDLEADEMYSAWRVADAVDLLAAGIVNLKSALVIVGGC